MIYTTVQGDVLDSIVHRFYGKTRGYVEKVLEANRHLADLGDVYDADIKIKLPDISEQTEVKEISIWD